MNINFYKVYTNKMKWSTIPDRTVYVGTSCDSTCELESRTCELRPGRLRDDGSLQLMKKTGVIFFFQTILEHSEERSTITIETKKIREKNLDIRMGFSERHSDMGR